jgi:hypothetical protein
MSTRNSRGAVTTPAWEAVAITVSRIEGLHGQAAWRCRSCGLILGGAPAKAPLDHCPTCALARGESVAFVVRGGDLVDSYRSAKSAMASDEAEHAAVSSRGNYDVDGDAETPASQTIRSEEHRSALALADATLARSH